MYLDVFIIYTCGFQQVFHTKLECPWMSLTLKKKIYGFEVLKFLIKFIENFSAKLGNISSQILCESMVVL